MTKWSDNLDPSYGSPIREDMNLMDHIGILEQQLNETTNNFITTSQKLYQINEKVSKLYCENKMVGRSFKLEKVLRSKIQTKTDLINEKNRYRIEIYETREKIKTYEKIINSSIESTQGMEFGLEGGKILGQDKKTLFITHLIEYHILEKLKPSTNKNTNRNDTDFIIAYV